MRIKKIIDKYAKIKFDKYDNYLCNNEMSLIVKKQ